MKFIGVNVPDWGGGVQRREEEGGSMTMCPHSGAPPKAGPLCTRSPTPAARIGVDDRSGRVRGADPVTLAHASGSLWIAMHWASGASAPCPCPGGASGCSHGWSEDRAAVERNPWRWSITTHHSLAPKGRRRRRLLHPSGAGERGVSVAHASGSLGSLRNRPARSAAATC